MDVTSALATVEELPAPIRDVVFQGMQLIDREMAVSVSTGLAEVHAMQAEIVNRSQELSRRLTAGWPSGQAVAQGYFKAGQNAAGQQSITQSLADQNSSFISTTDYTNLNALVMGFSLLATAVWQLATMEVGELAEAAAARAALEKALAECEARVAADGAAQAGLRAAAAQVLEPLWAAVRTIGRAFVPEIRPGMSGWAIARGVAGKALIAGQGGLSSLGVQLYLDHGQLSKVDWGMVVSATEGSVLGFIGGDLLARRWGAAVDSLLGQGEQGVVAALRQLAARAKLFFGVDLTGQDVEAQWLARRLSSGARQRAVSWLDAGAGGLSAVAMAGRRVIVPLAVGGLGGLGGGLAAGVGQVGWELFVQQQNLSWAMATQVLDSGISGVSAGAAGAVFQASHGFWNPGTETHPVDVQAVLGDWTMDDHYGRLGKWLSLPDADGVIRPHELTWVARGSDENGAPIVGLRDRGVPNGAFVDHLRLVEQRDGYQAAVELADRAAGVDPVRLHNYFERYFGDPALAAPPASDVPMEQRVQDNVTDAVLFALFPPVHLTDIPEMREAVAGSYARPSEGAPRPITAAERRYVEQFQRVFEPLVGSSSDPLAAPMTPEHARAVFDAVAAVAAAPGRQAIEDLAEITLRAVAAPPEADSLPVYTDAALGVLTPDAMVRDAAGARAVAQRLMNIRDDRDALATFRINRDVVNQAIVQLRAEASVRTAPTGAAAPGDRPRAAPGTDTTAVVTPGELVDGLPLIAADNARESMADCLDRVDRALALWNLEAPPVIPADVPRDVALMRRLERFRDNEPGILPDGMGPDWVIDQLRAEGDTAVVLVRLKGTAVWHAYAVGRTYGEIIVVDSGRQFHYVLDRSGQEQHNQLPLPDGVTDFAQLETAVAMFRHDETGMHPNPPSNWAPGVQLREFALAMSGHEGASTHPNLSSGTATGVALGTLEAGDPILGSGPGGAGGEGWPGALPGDPSLTGGLPHASRLGPVRDTDGETLAAHLAAGRKAVVRIEIPMADVLHGYPGQYAVTTELLERAGGLNGLQHDLRGAAEAVRQLRGVGGRRVVVDVEVEVVIDPRRPGGGQYSPDQVERFRRSVAGLVEGSASDRRGRGGPLGREPENGTTRGGGGGGRGMSWADAARGSGGAGSGGRAGGAGGGRRGGMSFGEAMRGSGGAGSSGGAGGAGGGRGHGMSWTEAMRGSRAQPIPRPSGGSGHDASAEPDPLAAGADAPAGADRVGDLVDALADKGIAGVGVFRWELDDKDVQLRFVLVPDGHPAEPVELWTGPRIGGGPTWEGSALGNLRAGLLDGVAYRVVAVDPTGSDPALLATLRAVVAPVGDRNGWLLKVVDTTSGRGALRPVRLADAISNELGFPGPDRPPDQRAGGAARLGAGRTRLAADDATPLPPAPVREPAATDVPDDAGFLPPAEAARPVAPVTVDPPPVAPVTVDPPLGTGVSAAASAGHPLVESPTVPGGVMGVANDGSAPLAMGLVYEVPVVSSGVGAAGFGPAQPGCADVSLQDFHALAPDAVGVLPPDANRRGTEVNAVDVLQIAGGQAVVVEGNLQAVVEHVLTNGDVNGGAALVLLAYRPEAGHIVQVRPELAGDNPMLVAASVRGIDRTGLFVVDTNVHDGRPREVVRGKMGRLLIAGEGGVPELLEGFTPIIGCGAIYFTGAPGHMTPETPLTSTHGLDDMASLWYSGPPPGDTAGSARQPVEYQTPADAIAAMRAHGQVRDELAGRLGVARPVNSRDAAAWRDSVAATRAHIADAAARAGLNPDEMSRQLDALDSALGAHRDAVAELQRLDPRQATAAALGNFREDIRQVVEGTGMVQPGDLTPSGLSAVLEEWRNVPATVGGVIDNLRMLAPDYLLAAQRVRELNARERAQSAAAAEPPVADIFTERDRVAAEHAAAMRTRHVFQDGPLRVSDAVFEADPAGVVARLHRTRPDLQEQVQALADAEQRAARAQQRLDRIDQQIAAGQWRVDATTGSAGEVLNAARGSADGVPGQTCVNGHLITAVNAPDNRCPACDESVATSAGNQDIVLVSRRGRTHDRNEDAVAAAIVGDVRVAAVGDGVSDSTDSQLASRAATTSFVDQASADLAGDVAPARAVRNGLVAAQDGAVAVGAGYVRPELPDGRPDPRWKGPPMSTLVGITVAEHGDGQATADVVWIGNSRAYWIPKGGAHNQLTVDDEESAQVEGDDGKPVTAKYLSQWLGSSGSADDERVYPTVAAAATDDTHTGQVTVTGPGWFVLASDGLFGRTTPQAMADMLGGHPGSLLDAATAMVNSYRSSDDRTAVVLPVSGPPEPEPTPSPGSGKWTARLES